MKRGRTPNEQDPRSDGEFSDEKPMEDELESVQDLAKDAQGEDGELDAEEAEEQERLKMSALLDIFTPEQLTRYEHFRRSHFRRSEVSKVMQAALGDSAYQSKRKVNEKMAIVLGGAAKLYAGELVEAARSVMEHRHEAGAIQPRHLREAFRAMKRQGKVPRPTAV